MYSTDNFGLTSYLPLIFVSVMFFGYEVVAVFDHSLPTISHAIWQVQRIHCTLRCLLYGVWGSLTWHLFLEALWWTQK